MAAFAVFVLLLSLYSSINADFIRCYDGTDEYKVVEADNPICAFTVRYPDDKCTKKATVYKGKSDLTKHEGKATCYYSFKRTAIICHCHGDLCNTDANIIKILTMELAKGAPKSMKKVVNCFLSQNDAKPTSDPVEDDPKLSPQSAKQLENERQGVLGSGKLMKKGHISSGKLHGQHKAKSTHFDWFPIIGTIAVVVILVDMALIVAIVLLVVRNRKLGKETDDKEKSLRASIQSRESEEPSYPFPEYSGENDASAPAQWNRVTDQEAVERIDAEIRKERKKERENEKQKEQERSRRKRERESRKEKEEQDEGSASQEDS